MDEAAEPRPLGRIIGEVLSETRFDLAITQDELARRLRSHGLPWTRAILIALETGRRDLVTLEELILLSKALDLPLRRWFRGSDRILLTPPGSTEDEPVRGAMPEVSIDSEQLRSLFTQKPKPANWKLESSLPGEEPELSGDGLPWWWKSTVDHDKRAGAFFGPSWYSTVPKSGWEAIFRAAEDQAEVKAARRLNVHPFDVACAAHKLWGRSLTEERERRVSEREMPPRALQAARGHITRELLAEILPVMGEASIRAESSTRPAKAAKKGRQRSAV